MSEPPSKFRVAICGGGIGGLTLAFALSKSPDIGVDVYEAASQFTEVGAGIGVWWRTRQVLKALGLKEDIERLLTFTPSEDRVPSVHYRKGDQPDGCAIGTTFSRGGLIGLHRADFHAALLNRLPSRCRTFTSRRLESYTQQPDGQIRLDFQDGSITTCDILIGADGVKSVVRKGMLQEAAAEVEVQRRDNQAAELRSLIEPRFSGIFCYRALIPVERLSRISPQHSVFSSHVVYQGKNKHIIAYQISCGRFINFVACEVRPDEEGTHFEGAWVTDADPTYVSDLFHGWDKEASDLVQCLHDLKMTRWVINVLATLPFYAFGKVAVLGDAAHAMTPFQGAGAGQAMEDAWILAALLSHPLATRDTATQVLGIYSRIRQPLATEVVRLSRINGEHFALRRVGPDASHSQLQEIVKDIQENFDQVSETDAAQDMQRAMELLQAELTAEH